MTTLYSRYLDAVTNNGKIVSQWCNAKYISSKDNQLLLDIIAATNFLPEDSPLNLRMFYVYNNLPNQLNCLVCGTPIVPNLKNGVEKTNVSFCCCKNCINEYRSNVEKYLPAMNITDNDIELLKVISPLDIRNSIYPNSEYYHLLCKIFTETKWLSDKVSITLRIYSILNNIKEYPKCDRTGCCNNTSIDFRGEKFNQYCSEECRTGVDFHSLPEDIRTKLLDKEYLIELRINKQMSYEDIGKELGISYIPVKEACKIHNIMEVKYNESNPIVKGMLRDKELLIRLHKEEKKTCQEIADIIGTSKATVSIALSNLGIEVNKSNSYDRPFIKISRGHQEMMDYLTSLGINYKCNDRITIGEEMDIYIPELKIGIEYNGIYTHHERLEETTHCKRKDRTYHIGKFNKARDKGIHLMQFWDVQWERKQDIVKSIIASKVGATNKLYARKCEIIEVPTGECNKFLDENHLQGSDRASIRYGLIYDGELVAAMTFCKSRYNKNYEWELSRFAGKKFTTIVGGFSKLLKHFRKNHSGSIISYSDSMWSLGEAYQNNGFSKLKENPAGYHYVSLNKFCIYHRSNFRKDKITTPDDPRTEREIMVENGYKIIWDCGNAVWVIE